MNPVASLYNSRMQVHAALEMACMDVAGKALGIRACDLIGGALRESIPFASYLFYRYGQRGERLRRRVLGRRDCRRGQAPEAAQRVQDAQAQGRRVRARARRRSVLCAGRRASRRPLPARPQQRVVGRGIRSGSPARSRTSATTISRTRASGSKACGGCATASRFPPRPTPWWSISSSWPPASGRRRSTSSSSTPPSGAVCGKLTAPARCSKPSSSAPASTLRARPGIQLASMLHLGAALPNMSFAADAHYHHLLDDIIVGGKMKYVDGEIALPKGPGLGVEVDRDKLAHYAGLLPRCRRLHLRPRSATAGLVLDPAREPLRRSGAALKEDTALGYSYPPRHRQDLRRVRRHQGRRSRHRGRHVRGAGRPVRLRQIHHPAG